MGVLDDFFADWTEERAAEDQQYMREEVAEVETALAAGDWKKLSELGYVTTEYRDNHKVGAEDENAILSSKQFNGRKLDRLKSDLALTPGQLAKKMNAKLNL